MWSQFELERGLSLPFLRVLNFLDVDHHVHDEHEYDEYDHHNHDHHDGDSGRGLNLVGQGPICAISPD